MPRPRILLVTRDYRTRTAIYTQISEYFGDSVEVLLYGDGVQEYDDMDIILVSSKELIRPGFPQHKLHVARRAIDISKLEELIAMPSSAKCLVVNNFQDTVCETIELLQNLGFAFEMFPYYPGIEGPIPEVDATIVPAAVEMIPKWMPRVINIGVRPVDFSTLVELSVRLNLPRDRAHVYAARYVHEIVALSRKLSGTLDSLKNVNRELDTILNTVHDGIVATDHQGSIIRMNKSAERILGLNSDPDVLVGQSIHTLFPGLSLDVPKVRENVLFQLKDKCLVINNTPLKENEEQLGLVTAFQDVTRIQQLEQHLRKELQTKGLSSKYNTEHILGESPVIKETVRIMSKIAKTDQTIVIFGESGTGKELFAHSIHNISPRQSGPFLPVNFAGLPESLAESELFGYDEGSFTGARRGGKPGLFELAHNGTLFLDEIGDAPLSLQALLLRVLQEKQVMRVGGNKMIPINVRVIAATNRNLKELVAQGKFRQDLYYRLHVLPLRVPALRERREDIPMLVKHFTQQISSIPVNIPYEVMDKLVAFDWPGNVRELIGVVQYMISVMDGDSVTVKDLPEQFDAVEERVNVFTGPPDCLTILKRHGSLSDFYTILRCLAEVKEERKGLGRGSILEYCEGVGLSLTDQQVRRRMEILGELGLLKAGIRGQGSQVTQHGLDALQVLHDYLDTGKQLKK